MLTCALLVVLNGPIIVKVAPNSSIRSLEAAIAKVRQIRQPGQPARIEIHPGVYQVRNGISLGNQDSGIVITGVGNPRLTGAERLAAATVSKDTRLSEAARGKVWESPLTDIDPGKMYRRGFGLPRQTAALELIESGRPLRIASWPNGEDWVRSSAVPSATTLTLDTDRPSKWSKDNEVWTLGYWQFDWAESYEPVTKIEGKEVTLAQKPGTFGFLAGRRLRFLNVVEELDQPGEYVVDRLNRKVLFWPVTHKEVVASLLDVPMFRLEGARDVRIQGLQLEGGRDSAILAKKSSDVQVVGCTIKNFGTYGVSFDECKDSIIRGCELTGLGEAGIYLNGGDRLTLVPGNLSVQDNHIWSYARWCRTYQPAIGINGVGNKIIRNYIHDAPHNAVLLSGNDHLIEYNRIERVCTETGDAGAIYMGRNPTMRGTVIRYNLLRELGPKITTEGNYTGVMGVYLDDCWCGTTVFGNVFDMRGTGIMIGGGRDNTVENNLFLSCRPAIHFDARGTGWAKDFFKQSTEWGMFDRFREVPADKAPYTTRYPQLATYLQDDPAFPKGNKIAHNVSVGGQWLELLDGLTLKDFINADNITEESAIPLEKALKLQPKGFRPIPIDRIAKVRK